MVQLTLDTLVEWNPDYQHNFGITDKELEIANEHCKVIDFWQKDARNPQAGDLVKGKEWGHGHEYEYGLIVKIEHEVAEVCYYPYVPFINTNDGRVSLSCSGGPFTHSHISSFKPVGEMKERLFKDWGRLGAGASQAFEFPAEVHCWELSEPISLSEYDWGSKLITYNIEGSVFFDRVVVPYGCKNGDEITVHHKNGDWFKSKCLGSSSKATIEFLEWKEANK